jgi:polyhydroxybutyrate depolymerase
MPWPRSTARAARTSAPAATCHSPRVRAALGVLAAALLAAGCGGASHSAARRMAPRPATPSCADRLPLDTLLRVPDGPRRPRPLILALHGARQSGYGLQSYTGFTDDAPGYLVAYPNTPHDNGFWRPDDVPALLELVDAIGRCTPVTEVSAVGFSNGGLMANALACRAARRMRAIVLVAAGYEDLGPCAPAVPVSVLSIHGSRDQVVAYRGMRAFVDSWARRDRCAPRPTARREVERITHLRWHGCAAGTRVEHLRVADDTHGWPSITDANERMVRFLRAVG